MFGFGKKSPPATAQPSKEEGPLEILVNFVDESCQKSLEHTGKFEDSNLLEAEARGDFRALVTMYAAFTTSAQQYADHMFAEWLKVAKGVGFNVEGTEEYWYLVNRRFAHVEQVRCFLDYRLKLTLVPADTREATLSTIRQFLSPAMSKQFLCPPDDATWPPSKPTSRF